MGYTQGKSTEDIRDNRLVISHHGNTDQVRKQTPAELVLYIGLAHIDLFMK